MKRLLSVAFILVLAGSGMIAQDKPPAANQVVLNGHTFTLPPGFEIELVAGPPLVDRPIVADFDDQGRLYVADSSGSNDKVDQQLQAKPHRILRLEDTDGDGKFDKRTIYADRMMFPEGVMYHAGSVYVSAPPSIWKLTDTKGEGVADQRSEWFQGKTLTGCANDLHGPYLGPDGWIYWCKGAFAKQTYERPGKPPLVTRAAHIFRSRPDGSGIEPVMTGGMDNPVEVVFTPGGERIFTTTFLQRPGGGKRDGLIHAIYGGIYGKEHDVTDDHPHTRPGLMPPLVHLGAAAPSGLCRYESQVFGAEYQDNLFASLFNMQKITRHVLEPSGATFKTRDEDFLVSSNRDFHPTDVLEDADGSLLVVDTGGWYKLCCPTSQLHKPDILGGIYRIRRKDAAKVEDPRGLKLAWSEMPVEDLALLLDDHRPAVRKRAIQRLSERGDEVIPALEAVLRSDRSSLSRRNAVWTACRIPHESARALVRVALSDADETVRQAAIHAVSVHRDREATAGLVVLLNKPSAQNQRAAAEALGRIGDKYVISDLVVAISKATDPIIEHSLTYALIEIGDPVQTATALKSSSLKVRRAAMMALDQMNGGRIDADSVCRDMTSKDPALQESALWIAGRHPEWGSHLSTYLAGRMKKSDLKPEESKELVRQLALFARAPEVQGLIANQLADPKQKPNTCLLALKAMGAAGLKATPPSWISGLTNVLQKNDPKLLAEALTAARALTMPKQGAPDLAKALAALASLASTPAQLRLTALASIPGGPGELAPTSFDLVRTYLEREQPAAERGLAADILSRAKLSTDQLLILTQELAKIGPMELERLLDAFVQSKDDRVGQSLLSALGSAPIRASLRIDSLKTRLAKYSPQIQKQAEELYAIIDVDAAKQKAHLEKLLGSLETGDIRRGQLVFNGTKGSCSACHAVGYLGGNVGPDLTHIARIRNERDLLESIVYPSASFVRSYEPILVTTKSGKVINGLIRKDAPDELVLATGLNQETRIPREEVDEIQPGKVSIMPAGLDQQLTVQELSDLIAFLKTCK